MHLWQEVPELASTVLVPIKRHVVKTNLYKTRCVINLHKNWPDVKIYLYKILSKNDQRKYEEIDILTG